MLRSFQILSYNITSTKNNNTPVLKDCIINAVFKSVEYTLNTKDFAKLNAKDASNISYIYTSSNPSPTKMPSKNFEKFLIIKSWI
jgi:hypothetical protein